MPFACRTIAVIAAILLFCLASTGCESTQEDTAVSLGSVPVCRDCGEIKGADACCDASAERCACGMIKGSPGCCQDVMNDPYTEGDPIALCASCGEFKGTDECCDKNAERCACGMIKGAPGCCKINK